MSESDSTKSSAEPAEPAAMSNAETTPASNAKSTEASNARSTHSLEDRQFGPVTVLFGEKQGKYPQGNSLLIRGSRETVLIDPSLGVIPRRHSLPPIDRLLFSHCHEDHISGAYLFPEIPWHFHELDLPGIQSLEAMMAIYGFPEPTHSYFSKQVVEQFHFKARPDAEGFRDGDVFDLGGVRVHVIHAPGHTRGHCCFLIESGLNPDSSPDSNRDWDRDSGPDERFLFLGDIDLSSFGPYYGDAWADLEDFERTLERLRGIEARWYGTFHHIGVLDREAFLDRLARFVSAIGRREQGLLSYLAEAHDLDEIAAQNFVYSRGKIPTSDAAERRSMIQHVERLVRSGTLRETSPGRWIRTKAA